MPGSAKGAQWMLRTRKRAISWRNWLLSNGFSNRVYAESLTKLFGRTVPQPSDISDHLNTLYFMASMVRPKLLVECGVRSGNSTRALLAAAGDHNAHLISIDTDDCSAITIPLEFKALWHFVRADDVTFLTSEFEQYCRDQGLASYADLVFIDTSHSYEHTRAELEASRSILRPGGLLLLHDTNLRRHCVKLDNSIVLARNIDRGVMRAVEKFMDREYDENLLFSDNQNGWVLFHMPYCAGLTILRKPFGFPS